MRKGELYLKCKFVFPECMSKLMPTLVESPIEIGFFLTRTIGGAIFSFNLNGISPLKYN